MGCKKIGGFHTPTTLGGLRDLTKDNQVVGRPKNMRGNTGLEPPRKRGY
jgi:hypothetical protein